MKKIDDKGLIFNINPYWKQMEIKMQSPRNLVFYDIDQLLLGPITIFVDDDSTI